MHYFEENDLVRLKDGRTAMVYEVLPQKLSVSVVTNNGIPDNEIVDITGVMKIGSIMVDNMKKEVYKKRVDELSKKDLIKEEQVDSLKAMIDSPDMENFDLADTLMSLKIEEKLVEQLNDGQTAAFIEIIRFFEDRVEDALVLQGYAGTGKTFLVNKIIEYITTRFPNRRLAITAPTNKAVRVLTHSGIFNPSSDTDPIFDDLFDGKDRIVYQTIHSLLGLREQIDAQGNQTFAADKKTKSNIKNFKYLIVDEVSMLDDVLCTAIMKHKDTVNIIFMGDPAQIPPINKSNSIPFRVDSDYVFNKVMLKQIMRQKEGNPIVETSFILRENLTKAQPIRNLKTELDDSGNGVICIDGETEREKVREILQKYFPTDEFKANANYAKVLAWRNKTVNYMNDLIRKMLYGEDVERYVVGEKLIANKPIFQPGRNKWGRCWDVQFTTSEEFEVYEVNIISKSFREEAYAMDAQIYQCKVKGITIDGTPYKDTINIMHEDSTSEWKELVDYSKKHAHRLRKPELWVVYFNIMKWSADVGYNYAITCHKSQGSTYQNVLLIEEDVDYNRNIVERNRIKYTAYTRPTDKLYVLRKNYE